MPAPQLLVKISPAIPPALGAILGRAFSARNVEDVTAAAVAAQTAVAAVPIAVAIVVRTAGARVARDSNAVPAAPVDPGMIAVTAAIPARRAVRNSSAKC